MGTVMVVWWLVCSTVDWQVGGSNLPRGGNPGIRDLQASEVNKKKVNLASPHFMTPSQTAAISVLVA